MKVVIFAGGVGTRLWPLSRKNTPKQFEKIIGDKSTLQLAVDRLDGVCLPEDIYISSGIRYEDILCEQLPFIPQKNFILEPEMRDVGAAVGLVTAILDKIAPDEPFFILWSDHMVKNLELFHKVLANGAKILEDDPNKIIFLGQVSRFGSQNLGWIEHGQVIKKMDELDVFAFKSFHYRPKPSIANDFHKSPVHVWNPGYFGTTPAFLFSLYKKFAPDMHENLVKIKNAWNTDSYTSVLNKLFPTFPKESFDNLILEKIDASDAYVIGVDLGWSDIGAWEQLKEALVEDARDNLTKGKVLITDSNDTLMYNYSNQLLIGIDLKEMLVINTDDVTLVCQKSSVPKIKKLVESLSGTEHENLT